MFTVSMELILAIFYSSPVLNNPYLFPMNVYSIGFMVNQNEPTMFITVNDCKYCILVLFVSQTFVKTTCQDCERFRTPHC